MSAESLVVVVLAGLASLFMAWTIGAGSSGSTPFAPAVGANAISVMRAGFVVGFLGFAGAVFQGTNVSEAVGRELVQGVTLSPLAATTGLLVAAVLVAIGVFSGYPIATAFTVTGAVVGVGLALGGDPAWGKYQQIGSLWLLTPVAGGGSSYLLARVLLGPAPVRFVVPVLGAVVGVVAVNVEFAVLGPPTGSASVVDTAAALLGGSSWPVRIGVSVGVAALAFVVTWWQVAANARVGQQRFLLLLGGLVAFSAGGSQVGLAIGPLLPLLDPYSVPLTAVLVGGGIGLLVGSWTGAPRLIKAIAQDYSSLGPQRSIAALLPSFVIAQVAVFYGIPVSFNEIIVSAVVGGGYAAGSGGSRSKLARTGVAWIGSLVLAFCLAYGGFALLTLVQG
jgi:PiT family inorganic phosphate transporter